MCSGRRAAREREARIRKPESGHLRGCLEEVDALGGEGLQNSGAGRLGV